MELTVEELRTLLVGMHTLRQCHKDEELEGEVHELKDEVEELQRMLAMANKDPNMVQRDAMIELLYNRLSVLGLRNKQAVKIVDELVKVGWPE